MLNLIRYFRNRDRNLSSSHRPRLTSPRHCPKKLRSISILILFALPCLAWATAEPNLGGSFVLDTDLLPLEELEKRRDATRAELNQLANFNLNGSVGSICFRSMPQAHESDRQWVQITLDREYPIDEIALVPALWRDNENGYRDDGFPRQFQIFAGRVNDEVGQLMADVTADGALLPRVAPLIIPGHSVIASWIRIEAALLSPRFHDGGYILQFAEVMVFSGSENVALHQTVTASSSQRAGIGAYKPEFLVDGFLPYIMDAAQGQKSNPYLSGFDIGDQATLTIDLGVPTEITTLRIHAIEQGDTVPHALQPNFAVPPHFIFEGANQENFSDAVPLWDYQHRNLFEIAPIVTQRIKPQISRYVRLRCIAPFFFEGFTNSGMPVSGTRVGFAEIELFSGAENVALGKDFTANYDISLHDPNRPLSRLTDGHNIFGKILPFREWISQLARRHDLEFQLPIVERAIQQRYEDQKSKLRLWVGIAALLGVLTIIVFLADRILRQRAIFKTRERIAADLHDELGANLHAIALLGDLALEAKDSPERSAENIERIRTLVKRTSKAVKYCTNMMETPGLYQNLPLEMKQISRRLMSDLDHTLEFEGEDRYPDIRPQKRIDLFLFYKESLINILRHSKATVVRSKLTMSESELELSVIDNGQGIDAHNPSPEPPSLKRRARLLGGKLSVMRTAEGGTSVILKMSLGRHRFSGQI